MTPKPPPSRRDRDTIGLKIRGPAPIAAPVGPQMRDADPNPDDHIRPADEKAAAGIGGIVDLPKQPPM
jgi:hypothetical protein